MKMKKGVIVGIAVTSAVVLAVSVGVGAFFAVSAYKKKVAEQIIAEKIEAVESRSVVIKDGDVEHSVGITDLYDLTFEEGDLVDKAVRNDARAFVENLAWGDRVASVDAEIVRGDEWFELHDDEHGNELNFDRVVALLDTVDDVVDVSKAYIDPDVAVDDLESLWDKLEAVRSWVVSYGNGFSITGTELYEYVSVDDGKAVFNDEGIAGYISQAVSTGLTDYDSIGNERTFTDRAGKERTVSGGTYGSYYLTADEIAAVLDMFARQKSEEGRTPVMGLEVPNGIPDKRIEISISEQRVFLVNGGKIVLESPTVTGDISKGRDTPYGVYYVFSMVPGTFLIGDGSDGSEPYKVWVDRWMPITPGGVGLHDAGWRKAFGGDIYKTDGSHGCINLPPDFAKELFDNIELNICVVVY